MNLIVRAALGACAAALIAAAATAAAVSAPPNIAAAVANPARPDADRQRDDARKPAELLTFAGVQPGWKVVDFIPGTGYFSRVLASAVGPQGHVYAFLPVELQAVVNTTFPPTGTPIYAGFGNVTVITAPANAFATPEKVDMVWISDNYHDLHDPFLAPADVKVINKAVFEALKPGGVYLIVDHAAPAGSGLADTNTLHRIDEATLKAEVEAAGFVLDGESEALRNPADDHTLKIFDPAIRGHTDQFVLRFRKPG
jgi:predicted methyltransferase